MTEDRRAATAIAEAARAQDPSLDLDMGTRLAQACLQLLTERPERTAADVAREMVRTRAGADVSWITHIAVAAVAYRQSVEQLRGRVAAGFDGQPLVPLQQDDESPGARGAR